MQAGLVAQKESLISCLGLIVLLISLTVQIQDYLFLQMLALLVMCLYHRLLSFCPEKCFKQQLK